MSEESKGFWDPKKHQGPTSNQQIIVAVVTFIVFFVGLVLGEVIATKGSDAAFGTKGSKVGLETFYGLMIGLAVIFTGVYFGYAFHEYRSHRDPTLPYQVTFWITMVTYVLLLITCSLAIWMANVVSWGSSHEENGYKISLIVILVLGIVLPAFWLIFHNRDTICANIQKWDATQKTKQASQTTDAQVARMYETEKLE